MFCLKSRGRCSFKLHDVLCSWICSLESVVYFGTLNGMPSAVIIANISSVPFSLSSPSDGPVLPLLDLLKLSLSSSIFSSVLGFYLVGFFHVFFFFFSVHFSLESLMLKPSDSSSGCFESADEPTRGIPPLLQCSLFSSISF